jgi:hypothetical protein
MEKLSQYCSFVIYDNPVPSHGKLMLIDPYDYDTLQIFFDCDIHKDPNKIEVIDIANKKRLDFDYCLNKYIVNVDPRKAVVDPNYFINKIEICETNRINELKSIGSKEFPPMIKAVDFAIEREIKKIPTDKYLEMTIFPLLHTV